jgi:predicted DNA-binding protein (MmcQ/YjbR family)
MNTPIDPGDEWIADAVAALPGASFDYKPEWDTWVMWVGGKMFGMRGTHPDKGEIITLKGDPGDNEALRAEFDAVEPGYYSNKRHWNSVLLDRDEVPQQRVVELLDESYALVVASLPKRVRDQIAGQQ